MSLFTPTRPSGGSSQPPLPPHPEQSLWLLRIALLAVSLVWLSAQLMRDDLLPWAVEAAQATTAAGAPDTAQRVGAALTILLAQPDSPLLWAPVAGVLLLLLEAQRGLLAAAALRKVTLEGTRTFYRVRTLHPLNRASTPDPLPASMWAALLASMKGQGGDRVALSLSRTANLPAELGVQIRGLKSAPADTRVAADRYGPAAPLLLLARRVGRGPVLRPALPDAGRTEAEDTVAARRIVEGVLRGQDVTVQMEPWADPLGVVEPGMVIFSQELTLARSPHWPLTVAEDQVGGLLRSMARALAVPEGVRVQEYQILAAPTRDRGTRRWVGASRHWLARLRRSGSANLTGDVGVASEVAKKLGDAHAVVTIRMVVVAQSDTPAHHTAALTSLEVMRAALAELNRDHTLPHGQVFQELVPASTPSEAAIRRPGPARPPLLRRAHLAVAILMALSAIGLLAMLGAYAARPWGDTLPGVPQLAWLAHIWLWWVIRVVWGVTLVVAAVIAFWEQVLVDPWVALRRVARRRDSSDPLLLPRPLWRQPAILSSAELSRLWHLPDATAGTEMAWTPNRIIPAPASAFVPADTTTLTTAGKLPDQWLTLGHAFDSGGQLRPVGVPLKALHQMMHITAGMGAGKSQAAAAMCAQLIPHGFIILDGKGDDESGSLANVVRKLLPVGEEHRLSYLNVLETAYPIGLNPIYHLMVAMEQATSKAERDLYFNAALGLILGLFERLDPARWQESPGMQQYALMGSHLVLRTGSSRTGEIPTMAKVARALEDEAFRATLIARYPFKNDLIFRFWTQREEQLSEAQKSSLSALLRRLDLFMANPITRPMLTVERPSVDLRQAMDDGQIIIIPMPHRSLGGLAPLVGMLVLQSIVAAAYARKGDAQSRITAPVLVDEVQVFIVNDQSPDLEQAFTQLRGFAVPMIVLHQTLKQIGALKDTFTINASNRLILRTGEPDASEYAKMYSQAGLKPEDIKGMEALHHQYAVTLGPNREQLVFSLRPNVWPTPPDERLPPLPEGVAVGSWKELVPSPDPRWSERERENFFKADQVIAEVIYRDQTMREFSEIAGQMAQLPSRIWEALIAQWERIRAHHYQELLNYPAQEPDQVVRQTWLTNLRASRGALIEEAITLRQDMGMVEATQAQASHQAQLHRQLRLPPHDVSPVDVEVLPNPPMLAASDPSHEDMVRMRRARPNDMPGIANYEAEPEATPEAEPEATPEADSPKEYFS
ncbi:type IV secretory system conjugative DNA transfer family protein [Oscillochloris sp. ZM17-4]|uniref:type IV secretory system conjugative DNA transfer family protein n=1 Tax=Oscillochloris sp. ZM17-4 TaxID=2866714 RepID=UPI001C72E3A2|nr:type IV secretory system conjugative DNA transfer family protein [Oscillochloris sp. ZM17-4]MBX0331080.1 type IV secretory system conjugative DNA transfer family protein [Oscillochloris sp. ZM17-4]